MENKEYKLIFDFYGVEKPNIGDEILIHETLLDKTSKNYTQPYFFEVIEDFDVKLLEKTEYSSYIALRIKNKIYTLKRVYG